MANALYDAGREGFLDGSINWSTGDIRAILIHNSAGGTSYSPTLGTDKFLSSVAAGARVAVSSSFSSKTVTGGIADAADVTFTAVSGVQVDAILIYQHTGADATARLIAWIDTATGLPIVPNGGDITVRWANTTNKIFKL